MRFDSSIFLTYFLPAILLLYWIIPNNFKNGLLFIASLFFYAWGEPIIVFLLLGMTCLNFALTHIMHRSVSPKKWLVTYISLNIGLLVVFKYLLFLITELQFAFHINWIDTSTLKIPLPLGISFYAFHAITYAVDIYRKTVAPQSKLQDFGLYLFLFPHQIAGPIVCYTQIAHEIQERHFNASNFLTGLHRFSIGLAKKVLLANGLNLIIVAIDAEQGLGNHASILAWTEMLAYFFYIYFDFSGYSDMAIGLGRMFGFHFPENFTRPYTARSITEFWQRWHQSLGYFMKNYLYIPLGGNRLGNARTYLNLMLVFFLSGLWHGAAWNFILWGIFHGTWLLIERAFLGKHLAKIGWFAGIWTCLIVLNGWVFFHETTLSGSVQTFSEMWRFEGWDFPLIRDTTYFIGLLAISVIVLLFEYNFERIQKIKIPERQKALSQLIVMCLLYAVSYAYIIAGSYSPFIYFNF